jgi:hypothetical protein
MGSAGEWLSGKVLAKHSEGPGFHTLHHTKEGRGEGGGEAEDAEDMKT